ncbi:hypothetical protein AT15_00100 [Kosmotoga arenicorallina S304]|uniref:Peptidase MA-like domain-containing protein n=1 Tax=Kosmotoga arenicorallina S304 TaxID=1453497 RepID=A0A182C863_9BACT|nr:hypothetical protein [Kosmotoga arenicorallina]OAA32514.1 hypothetical protein AT15_00100 [Kosmotoga arenicorallina S304]
MKRHFLLAAALIIALAAFSYKTMFISWSLEEFAQYRERLETLTGQQATDTTYTVFIADSVSEFYSLSGFPYWVLAGVRGNVIFLQPPTLHKNLIRTLAHELTHLSLKQYKLPYWLEEGLVCIVTNEWQGITLERLKNIQEIDPAELDYFQYQKYCYTAWIEASLLYSKIGFERIIETVSSTEELTLWSY